MDWDTIGEGDHPAQNPPILTDEDEFILGWYYRNTRNYFVVNFQMFNSLIDDLRMDPGQKDLFMYKLNIIHQMDDRIAQKKK